MSERNHYSQSEGLPFFLFGTDYYPEQWDESDRKRDTELMIRAGVNCVRMGDLAWNIIEPEPDHFDFSFLDQEIHSLSRVGIRVILCTPAAVPSWFLDHHPEALRVENSATEKSIQRRICARSPAFHARLSAVVSATAQHYRTDESIIGWIVSDNLLEGSSACRCSNCRAAFRRYLAERYETVERINAMWGTVSSGRRYSSFDQIDMPVVEEASVNVMGPTGEGGLAARQDSPNPALLMAYQQFRSHEAASFFEEEVAILRNARDSWLIAQNIRPGPMDHQSLSSYFDVVSTGFFPMGLNPKERAAQCASHLDSVRSLSGNFLVSELQSGPVAYGAYSQDTPHPGQMRLFAYQAVAHGGDGLLHYRFRAASAGADQNSEGILGHDSRPAARYEEFLREGTEFSNLGSAVLGTKPSPEVGILLDLYANELSHLPHTLGLPSPAVQAESVHRTISEAGYTAGYANLSDSFAAFKLLVLAGLPILSADLVDRLATFVEMGGTLLVTARTGVKDENGNRLPAAGPGPIATLCGAYVRDASRVNLPDLFPNQILLASPSGDEYVPPSFSMPPLPQHEWIEALDPVAAEVLGTWQEYPYKGRAAITLNRVGMGKVIYLGTLPSPQNLRPLLFPLAGEASLVPLVSSPTPGVEVAVRQNESLKLYFVLNHTPYRLTQKGIPAGELLVGNEADTTGSRQGSRGRTWDITLGGYDVAVIKVPLEDSE